MRFVLSLSLLMVTALFYVSVDNIRVYAEDDSKEEAYKAAKKEYKKMLKSDDPDDRAMAAEEIAKTGYSKAAEDVFEALLKEKNNNVAALMGRSLRHCNSQECVDEMERKTLKLKEGAELFTAFYVFYGISLGKSEPGDALLRKAILDTRDKEMYIKVAALEAIAVAKHEAAYELIVELLKTKGKTWEEEHVLIPISACSTAGRISNLDNRMPLVDALITVLEQYDNDRVKYFAAQGLAQITGEKAYFDTNFWRFWQSMEGKTGGAEGKTSARGAKPSFFNMEVVGTRVVFVIDISGSMQAPVNPPKDWKKSKKKKKKDGPKTGEKRDEDDDGSGEKDKEELDWSKIKTKMDLAKAELIRTLKSFDEGYYVNVVVYDTTHELLISGMKSFTETTESNKKKLVAAVEKLQPRMLTNIHGALIHGLSITTKGECRNDPAWDADALAKGAETIFFLTDGAPSWSDDSKGPLPSGVGDGVYVNPNAIITDIARVNTFRKAVMHTVGIGPHDRQLLTILAQITGGTYTDRSGQ